jgi:STE24 endopeptidase
LFIPPEGGVQHPQVQYSGVQGVGSAVSPERLRRRADATAKVQLVAAVPWCVFSVVLVWLVSALLFSSLTATVITAVFLVSGVLAIFYPPAEGILARTLMRRRKPTLGEERYLRSLWQGVTQAAGIDGSRYTLWVEESEEVNATAFEGHMVSVTRWALENEQPLRLQAVLAHELGHHMGGHAWPKGLAFWYSWPARKIAGYARWFLSFFFHSSRGIAQVMLPWSIRFLLYTVGAVVIFGLAIAVIAVYPPTILLLPLLFGTKYALAYFGRKAESAADRFAADIGYGHLLIGVFYDWLREGRDVQHRQLGRKQRMLGTHPTLAKRIRDLEVYLEYQRA